MTDYQSKHYTTPTSTPGPARQIPTDGCTTCQASKVYCDCITQQDGFPCCHQCAHREG